MAEPFCLGQCFRTLRSRLRYFKRSDSPIMNELHAHTAVHTCVVVYIATCSTDCCAYRRHIVVVPDLHILPAAVVSTPNLLLTPLERGPFMNDSNEMNRAPPVEVYIN